MDRNSHFAEFGQVIAGRAIDRLNDLYIKLFDMTGIEVRDTEIATPGTPLGATCRCRINISKCMRVKLHKTSGSPLRFAAFPQSRAIACSKSAAWMFQNW